MKKERIKKPKVYHHSSEDPNSRPEVDLSELKVDVAKLTESLQGLKEEIDRILSEN